MTPIQDAKAEMLALRDHFNKRVNELAAEGLPFTVVADPSLPGFDILVPVARVAT